MSYIDDLQAGFDAFGGIADYRINLSERRSLGVGIRDNDVGSVYSPLSFGQSTGGGFMVQWDDGKLSRGNLDGNSLAILDEILSNARQAAYTDPDAAQFLGPQQVADVPLFSDDVPPLFDSDTAYLFKVIERLEAIGSRHSTKTLNGGVGSGMGISWLRTSRGLSLQTRSTSFSYSASFDGIIGEGRSQRVVAPLDEIEAQIEHAGAYLERLRSSDDGGANGTRWVVLHPDVAYSLFGFYVWGNLGGSAVFHGQSAFNADDFRSGKQVFRSDLSVAVDPWTPLGPGSFLYTAEGIPSAPITYIADGKLTEPVLDLKYARRLELRPNTPPGSEQSVRITADTTTTWPDLLPELDDAILVLSVLGLHTQDRSSGNYSLSTSQALRIANGTVGGRVKATLNGNFFANLRADELRLVYFAGQHSPGLALPLSVAIEQTA